MDEGEILERFTPLFVPRTVAVVGASSTGIGRQNVFIRRIRQFGFAGTIYPIHPSAAAIDGLPAYRSLAETPEPIDYAHIAVAAGQIPGMLAAAAGRVRFAQVISSGFGEVEDGKDLEERLVAAAREGGMRLLGPNCVGIFSPRGGITFTEIGPQPVGGIGVIAQSGGLGVDIIRRGVHRGLRFSGVVTVGNCADLGASDLVEFYLADPQTRVIGLYVEAVRDGRRLFELLRAAKARKPVVILKGGRTAEGTVAAASHTGALAGNDRAWVALSRQTGCVLVSTLEELIDALLIFQALRPKPAHPTRKVVLFGNGGGTSVLAADYFARLGLRVSPFDGRTVGALAALKLPPGTSINNPVDCPGGNFRKDNGRVATGILDVIYRLGQPESLVVHLNMTTFVGHAETDTLDNLMRAALRANADHGGQTHFILVLRSDGDPRLEERKRQFRAQATSLGVPVYDELTSAGQALSALSQHERFVHSRAYSS